MNQTITRMNTGTQTYYSWLCFIMLSLAFVSFLSSCDENVDTESLEPMAYVSLYHASPDAPYLDITVDEQKLDADPLQYADYTGYRRFNSGVQRVRINPWGGDYTVVDKRMSFEKSKNYSIFLVNEYSDLDMMVLENDAVVPGKDKALLRFINLSPDTPSVNLRQEDAGNLLASNKGFKEATDFVEVDANQYTFSVRNAETDEALLTVPTVAMKAGWRATIVLRGYQMPPNGNRNNLMAEVIVN